MSMFPLESPLLSHLQGRLRDLAQHDPLESRLGLDDVDGPDDVEHGRRRDSPANDRVERSHGFDGDRTHPSNVDRGNAPPWAPGSSQAPRNGDPPTDTTRNGESRGRNGDPADAPYVRNGDPSPDASRGYESRARNGDPVGGPQGRNGDPSPNAPSSSQGASSLSQLSPEAIRQLAQTLANDPATLRAIARDPEALAARMAGRAEAGNAQLAEARLAGDARIAAALTTGEGRIAGEAGHAAQQASQLATVAARLEGLLLAMVAARQDAATVAPGNTATRADATMLDPQLVQMLAPRAATESALHAHVDGATTANTVGLPSGFGATAAGVTMAAIMNPAGNPQAVAPQTNTRSREAERVDAAERDRKQPGKERGKQDDGRDQQQRRDRARDIRADDARPGQRSMPAANESTGDTLTRSPKPSSEMELQGNTVGSLRAPAIEKSDTHGHVGNATISSPEQRLSRRLQWLYWSLIVIAYACLAGSLTLILPDIVSPTVADGNAEAYHWKNVLVAIGLGSAYCGWLLGHRLRRC